MKTSIILLTHNQLDYTKQCIDSIDKYTDKASYELIVVDNGSTDGTVDWLKQQKNIVTILNSENLGFPKGCNQGINIATGENILLLNNDTIVTQNWLNNLLVCLYSSKEIGAVGPVTNSIAYYSTIPVNYTSIKKMHQFASKYNLSNPEKWEERLKLIGFCLLIKREVLDIVGMLDERFTPGNFEDDDFSVRLRQAGYRLMLCKDTFIHHFGSVSWREDVITFSKILTENEKKFKDKWGTDSDSYRIENEMIELIPNDKERRISVLHLGCGSGATLLKIKNQFPHAQLFGVEANQFSIEEANRFAMVFPDHMGEEIQSKRYDVILFTEELKLDLEILEFVKGHLTNNGIFIAKVANIGHFHVMQEMLKGNNPLTNRHMYSFEQLENLFSTAGFSVSLKGLKTHINEGQQEFINQISSLFGDSIQPMLESENYLIIGQLITMPLLGLLNRFSMGENVLEEINQFSTEIIIETVLESFRPSLTLLTQLASENYSAGYHDFVIPYFQAAIEEEPNDTDTLFNLAFVLNSYGEKDLANKYLSMIKNPDLEVEELFHEINEKPLKMIQSLTFLLRRLEFEINVQETKQMIVQKLRRQEIEESWVKDVISTSIVDKIKVYQALAITLFEYEMHDHVLTYLQAAYDLDPTNEDTLFNLGYVLLYYGQSEIAERFLKLIKYPNEEVKELLKTTGGNSSDE